MLYICVVDVLQIPPRIKHSSCAVNDSYTSKDYAGGFCVW